MVPDLPGVTLDATAYTQVNDTDAKIAQLISGGVVQLNTNLSAKFTNAEVDASNVDTVISAAGTTGTVDFTNVTKIVGVGEDVGGILDFARKANFGHAIDVDLTDTTEIGAKDLTDSQAQLSGGKIISSTIPSVTGSDAEIGALGDAITATNISIGNPAVTITGTATVANILKIATPTSGKITASVDASTAIATLKTLPAEDNALTIAIAADGGGHAAADITAVDARTTEKVDASAVTKVSGTSGEIDAFLAADVTRPADYDITASGTLSASKVNEYVTASGSGIVTANVSDTAANAKTLTSGGTDQINLVISNDTGATDAADLNAVDAKTAVKLDATLVTSITGSASDLAALEAAVSATPATVDLKADVAVEVSDGASVSLINDLAAMTAGDVTANASSNAFADFSGLSSASTDKITIQLTDASLNAVDLFATGGGGDSGLATKTGELLDLTGVAEIKGTVLELKTLIGKEGSEVSLNTSTVKLTVTGGEVVTIGGTDYDTATALDIKALADFTGGLVDATAIDIVKGVAAAISAVEALNDDAQLSIGDVAQVIYAAQPSDDTMYASAIRQLAADNSSGTVDLALVNTIKGSYADIREILISDTGTASPNIDMAGAKAYNLVVVTEGTPDVAGSVDTVAKVNELIDGANGGKVTVTVTETDADQLKTIKVGAGSNDLTISVAGASHVAGTLNTIDSVTALQVTTTEITDISGAADKVALALSSTGLDLNGKDINANVNSGTASLTQINDINGDNGTGTVTATLANTTDLADMVDVVNGLTTGIGDSIAITLKAESVSSTDLVTLERKTGLQIDAKAATTITGPYAEVKAVLDDTRNYDFTDADYNVTTSHLTTSLTADELITISGMTSGLVTATSVNTVTGAVDKLLTVANRNDGSDLLLKADYDATIDVSGGTTAAAADLKVILLDTTGTVTADGLTDISGEAADVDAVQTEVSFSHAGDDYTVTIADSANDLTVGEINDIAGRTSGVVTATATSNDIDDYNGTNATLTTGSNDAITIVITNASVDAADLKLLDGKTSVAIDAQAVTNLTGTANEIATIVSSSGVTLDGDFTATVSNEDGQAYVDAADIVTIDTASSGTITATGVTEMRGLADNIVSAATSSEVTIDGDMLFNVTSGEADVAQINTLDALTSNVITATLSDNGAVTLATLKNANANNALTITVTDTEVAASNLSKIDAATTVQVTATAVETLTGTLTAVNSILGAGGVSLTTAGVSAVAASLEDITVAAATVKNVDTLTDGDIAILQATAITGSAADIAAVVSSGGVTHVSGTLQATVDAGSVDAADLITIDDNSGRIVLAAAATTMTGTASEIETVIGRTSGIEVAGTAAATVDDGTATIAQVKTIDNGSRIVTATVDSGVVADLIHGTTGLPDSAKNVLSITVTDTSAAAADLTALAGKTTTKVIVTDVATITGSAGDMVALYDAAASDFTDLGSEALSVSGAAAATDLIALLSDTDQNISVAGVTEVHGHRGEPRYSVVGNARFDSLDHPRADPRGLRLVGECGRHYCVARDDSGHGAVFRYS